MRRLGTSSVVVLLAGCSIVYPHRGVGAPIGDTLLATVLAGTAVATVDGFGQPNSAFAQSDYSNAVGALLFLGAVAFAGSAVVGFTGRIPEGSGSMVPNQDLVQDGLVGLRPGSIQTRGASCRSDDDCGAGGSCTASRGQVGRCIPSGLAR